MLKELMEKRIKLAHDIRGFMEKSNGTPNDMTESDRTAWTQAVADFDKLNDQIDLVKQSEQATILLSQPAPGSGVASGARADASAKQKGKNIDHQFLEVLKSGHRSETYRQAWQEDAKLHAFSETDLSGAGYFVTPLQMAERIITNVAKMTYIRSMSEVYSVLGADSLGFVTSSDLNDFSWVAETAAVSVSTESTIGRRELQPHRGSKLIKLSRKLIRNAANAEAEFMRKITRSRAYTEEKAFISGTGVGQPLGFNVASTSGVSTSRDVSSGTANTVGFDDIVNAYALIEAGYRGDLTWFLHRNMEARIRKVKDSNNQYIWSPAGVGMYNAQTLVGGMPSTILGVPTAISEFMPDPGVSGNITTGTYPMTLANLKLGYIIVDNLLNEIIPLNETYANSNELGFVYNFETDGAPAQEGAFARVKVS